MRRVRFYINNWEVFLPFVKGLNKNMSVDGPVMIKICERFKKFYLVIFINIYLNMYFFFFFLFIFLERLGLNAKNILKEFQTEIKLKIKQIKKLEEEKEISKDVVKNEDHNKFENEDLLSEEKGLLGNIVNNCSPKMEEGDNIQEQEKIRESFIYLFNYFKTKHFIISF
jgi:hypothetical protein